LCRCTKFCSGGGIGLDIGSILDGPTDTPWHLPCPSSTGHASALMNPLMTLGRGVSDPAPRAPHPHHGSLAPPPDRLGLRQRAEGRVPGSARARRAGPPASSPST